MSRIDGAVLWERVSGACCILCWILTLVVIYGSIFIELKPESLIIVAFSSGLCLVVWPYWGYKPFGDEGRYSG